MPDVNELAPQGVNPGHSVPAWLTEARVHPARIARCGILGLHWALQVRAMAASLPQEETPKTLEYNIDNIGRLVRRLHLSTDADVQLCRNTLGPCRG